MGPVPTVPLIDRVMADNDTEAAQIKHRFGLTSAEIVGWRKQFPWPSELKAHEMASAVECLAESKVHELADEFGGEFVRT